MPNWCSGADPADSAHRRPALIRQRFQDLGRHERAQRLSHSRRDSAFVSGDSADCDRHTSRRVAYRNPSRSFCGARSRDCSRRDAFCESRCQTQRIELIERPFAPPSCLTYEHSTHRCVWLGMRSALSRGVSRGASTSLSARSPGRRSPGAPSSYIRNATLAHLNPIVSSRSHGMLEPASPRKIQQP